MIQDFGNYVYIDDSDEESGEIPNLLHYHLLLGALVLGAIAILIVVLEVPNAEYWVLLIFILYASGVVVDSWVHHFYH